jgi:hypothetical protein
MVGFLTPHAPHRKKSVSGKGVAHEKHALPNVEKESMHGSQTANNPR